VFCVFWPVYSPPSTGGTTVGFSFLQNPTSPEVQIEEMYEFCQSGRDMKKPLSNILFYLDSKKFHDQCEEKEIPDCDSWINKCKSAFRLVNICGEFRKEPHSEMLLGKEYEKKNTATCEKKFGGDKIDCEICKRAQ